MGQGGLVLIRSAPDQREQEGANPPGRRWMSSEIISKAPSNENSVSLLTNSSFLPNFTNFTI